MFRTLVLAAALGALALPAVAGTAVTVNVVGLDGKAAHAVIYHAAQQACRVELSDETQQVQFYNRPACISSAVTTAEAKLASLRGLASR
jgi:hypothetical protein